MDRTTPWTASMREASVLLNNTVVESNIGDGSCGTGTSRSERLGSARQVHTTQGKGWKGEGKKIGNSGRPSCGRRRYSLPALPNPHLRKEMPPSHRSALWGLVWTRRSSCTFQETWYRRLPQTCKENQH